MRGSAGWVRFSDDTLVEYTPPTDTRDPRYEACTDHRVACDCREALYAEDAAEWEADRRRIRQIIRTALEGHRPCCCRCSGCGIAREIFPELVRGYPCTHGWNPVIGS